MIKMKTINTFVDTSTVNRILDIEVVKPNDHKWEEDRQYLSKIIKNYVKKGIVQLFVNPSVEREIRNTKKDPQRKNRLLALFKRLEFTPNHKTVFPIVLSDEHPATFLSEEEKKTLEELSRDIPSFKKDDVKIFADAVFNSQIEVLLVPHEEHFLKGRFRNFLENKGLDKKIKVFTPKEFYEYLQKVGK